VKHRMLFALLIVFVCSMDPLTFLHAQDVSPATIVHRQDADTQVRLAAKEIRRYVYLRTGELLPIVESSHIESGVVGDVITLGIDPSLVSQQYALRTSTHNGSERLSITGGGGVSVLYGAYDFIEKLGVRFYLHGDVIPEVQSEFVIPQLDETHQPLFELRGLNPWGSHPFGFDLWNADDYRAHISQMTKMRMNFIGMHCYPEGHPYAEPTVWVGLEGDFDEEGRVTEAYPASYYNALFRPRWGGFQAGPTGEYHLGSEMLFDRDGWGPESMRGMTPRPETPEECQTVFNRTGDMFNEAFQHASLLGVKTCLGTESPLVMPNTLRERLLAEGKDPNDPVVVREVYEGMFQRIMAAHPLDYYWFWTPEGWTWQGNSQDQMDATMDDIRIAVAAMKKVDAPFKPATCGWVLGPQNDRSGFDSLVPEGVAISAISRQLGEDPVDPGFAEVTRRDKWAIPWMEGDNGGLAVPQLWVGRTRQDAADANEYGCTGLMGLIWRTKILAPNISALAHAGWDQQWASPPDSQGERNAIIEPLPEQARGGRFANYPNAAITGANPNIEPVYRTCRYDMTGYDLDIPNGIYGVTLQFCEPHFGSPEKRVCDLRIEGRVVREKLDIFNEVGAFAALDCVFDDVLVEDSQLTIDIVHIESMPCISGVIIEGEYNGRAYIRKINCGGPQLADYDADFPLAPTSTNEEVMRKAPCEDFYVDWASISFGPEAGEAIGTLFEKIDGHLPRPLSYGCPAGLKPNRRSWSDVAQEYDFVDELESLRDSVTGPENLTRFDYWLGVMQYNRAGAELDCAVGNFQAIMETVNAEEDLEKKTALAKETALPAYENILETYREGFEYLLATTHTKGSIATIMFWEQAIYPRAVDATRHALESVLGVTLDKNIATSYQGDARLIVPTVRSFAESGETLRIETLVLAETPPQEIILQYRELGFSDGSMNVAPLEHVARGVYAATLPPLTNNVDREYSIEAKWEDGTTVRFPEAGTDKMQTVVVMPE
jgi:hypothetical protein